MAKTFVKLGETGGELLVMLGAFAPQLIKCDVACDANCSFGRDINIISILGTRVGPEVADIQAFGCEFGVVGFFE